MRRVFVSFLFSLSLVVSAWAGVPCTVPNTFINGTIADAGQVDADFTAVLTCLLNAAQAGANNDIFSLNALSTPVPTAAGGSTIFVGGTSGGSPNAQTVAVTTPSGFTLARGNSVLFIAGLTNTPNTAALPAGSAMQINVSLTGLTNVFRQSPVGPQQMTGGEIVAGQLVWLVYDGTQFEMQSNGPQFGGMGPQTTIASAATTDLGTVASHNAVISGTAAITNFGQTAQLALPFYVVAFSGSPLITVNSTACSTTGGCIFTPGNANIQAVNGDVALLLYLGTPTGGLGNWQVAFYQRTTGTSPVSSTPNCGFNQLVWGNGASSSTVTAGWGSANLTTPGGVSLYSGALAGLTLNVTLGTGSPAAGGMDGHPPGINSFVYMYAISNGSAVNLIGSPFGAAGSVALPAGYTYICYLGAIKTNGTSNLVGTKGAGRDARLVVGGANLTFLPIYTVGVLGAGCTGGVPTYFAVNIAGSSGANIWAPATAVAYDFSLNNVYSGGSLSEVLLAPNNSYQGLASANPPPVGLAGASMALAVRILNEGAGTVYICSSASGGALLAYGWLDAVNAN